MTNINRAKLLQALPIAAALLVMLTAGWVQGVWSERWSTFPELKIYSDQLAKIPEEFGEWKGKTEKQSDEEVLKVAGAEGELIRTYRNGNNEEVRVSIICGRLQDVFYHTPDRCYPAAGFEMQGDPQPDSFEIDNGEAQFFTTAFVKSEPTGTHTERGYWSWSADGAWIAPKNPKLQFAGQRAIYKLYIFAGIPSGKQRTVEREYSRDFIRAFIPVLNAALRPAMARAGHAAATEQQQEAKADEAKPAEPKA